MHTEIGVVAAPHSRLNQLVSYRYSTLLPPEAASKATQLADERIFR